MTASKVEAPQVSFSIRSANGDCQYTFEKGVLPFFKCEIGTPVVVTLFNPEDRPVVVMVGMNGVNIGNGTKFSSKPAGGFILIRQQILEIGKWYLPGSCNPTLLLGQTPDYYKWAELNLKKPQLDVLWFFKADIQPEKPTEADWAASSWYPRTKFAGNNFPPTLVRQACHTESRPFHKLTVPFGPVSSEE
jgi:hypothetical protein